MMCAVLALYLLLQSLKPQELRSQGQLPPNVQHLWKLISFSLREYPTVGYLATEKKLKSSDRPQWKAFNPTQGLLWWFLGDWIYQSKNKPTSWLLPWARESLRGLLGTESSSTSLPQHGHNTHEQEQGFSWPCSVQSRFNLPGYWPGIRLSAAQPQRAACVLLNLCPLFLGYRRWIFTGVTNYWIQKDSQGVR